MKVQTNVAEKQEIFVIDVDAKIARIVSESDRKNLVDAYLKLFTNFSILNWTNGCSLGCAWQKGLGQCGSFVDVKKAANPAAQYLKSVYKSHKVYWSRVIMTSKISENKNNLDASVAAKVRASAMKKIRETMDYINLILGKYNEYAFAMNIEKAHLSQHQQSVQNANGMAMPVPQSMPAPVIERTQMMPEKVAVEQVAAKPIARPIVKPMEQVVAKPVVRPVAKPMEQVVAKPVARPIEKKPDNAIKFIGAKQKVIEQGACIQLNMKKQQINLVALQNFAQRAA